MLCLGVQGIIWPQVITGAAGNVLNAIINYVFLSVLHLGVAWVNSTRCRCLPTFHASASGTAASLFCPLIPTHAAEVGLQLLTPSPSIPWPSFCLSTSAPKDCTKLLGLVGWRSQASLCVCLSHVAHLLPVVFMLFHFSLLFIWLLFRLISNMGGKKHVCCVQQSRIAIQTASTPL